MREGPEERTDADRQCPARDHGQCAGGGAGARSGRNCAGGEGRGGGGAFAWRIFRAGRRGRVQPGRYRAAAAHSRRCDAGGGAARRGRDVRVARRGCGDGAGAWPMLRAQGEVCEVANDNDPGQVVLSGHLDCDRSRGGTGEGARQQAGDQVARFGALPLFADAARRRADGRGIGRDTARRRSACRSTPMSPPPPSPIRRATARCWSNRSPAGCAGAKVGVAMHDAGITHFVELGGKVLGPMIRKIAPDADGDQRGGDGRYRYAGRADLTAALHTYCVQARRAM